MRCPNLIMQKHFCRFLVLFVSLTILICPPCSWGWRRRRRRYCPRRNCVLDSIWRNAGSCSQTCGHGRILQIRNIRQYPSCGGTPCPSSSSSQRRRYAACYRRCCPVNCLWRWGPWGSCLGCGMSTQRRTMSIVRNPSCGGTVCPSTRTQTQSCNTGM